MDYAADHDIALVAALNQLKKIPFHQSKSIQTIQYMSMEAITAMVQQTNDRTPKGLRDRFFMILLYDTGARVQKVLDIKLCAFQLGRTPKVTLFGKGRKTRVVPLMEKTVQHLQKYLAIFHPDVEPAAEPSLFYS